MVPTENGLFNDEIQEELEPDRPSNGMKLVDYIPIYIPAIERGLMEHNTPHEKRFLDFLKARPTRDWFLKFGFMGRSPPSSLQPNGQTNEPSSPSDPARSHTRRRRFRVPFVRKINWAALVRYFKKWIRRPANMALVIWLIFVAAGLILYFSVLTGILNQAIPSSNRRKDWAEVINQILNALFMIMCLYQHPNLFHHLVLLCRWEPSDRVEIRKVYCKGGTQKPHDRAHMMFVVILLHLTCCSQYVMSALFWAYNRHKRPDWAVTLCLVLGIVFPIIAAVYALKGPLGRKTQSTSEMDQESQQQGDTDAESVHRELSVYNHRVVVTEPEWIGGLFDCGDDLTVASCSFLCTFCVFGWNLERLGFGNMYVHMFTFILLCIAPFLIFGAAALNIEDYTIGYIVVITGAVLCLFGLLYGGFWRTEMRKKFKLPAYTLCCGNPWLTDYMQWLFCWACSLAQEVRTANFFDIEDDRFYRKVSDENGRPVLLPLPREGESGSFNGLSFDYSRSYSSPPQFWPNNQLDSSEEAKGFSPVDIAITFGRASTYSKVHAMKPPVPPLIQTEGKSQLRNS